MGEKAVVSQPEGPVLPEGSHLVIDEGGNVVGAEIRGLTITDEDFDQATIDALQKVFENPVDNETLLDNLIRK